MLNLQMKNASLTGNVNGININTANLFSIAGLLTNNQKSARGIASFNNISYSALRFCGLVKYHGNFCASVGLVNITYTRN